MIHAYVDAAMGRARYELIDGEEPYYGEVPELQGVWASGRTLEECRHNLVDAVDGWLLVRIARRMEIPVLGETHLMLPAEMPVA